MPVDLRFEMLCTFALSGNLEKHAYKNGRKSTQSYTPYKIVHNYFWRKNDIIWESLRICNNSGLALIIAHRKIDNSNAHSWKYHSQTLSKIEQDKLLGKISEELIPGWASSPAAKYGRC